VKADKVAMKRVDTYKAAADLCANFGIAGKVFFWGLCGLLPRLGNRAANIAFYGLVISILLYAFVVHGLANLFVNGVRSAVLAFLNPTIKDVAEF